MFYKDFYHREMWYLNTRKNTIFLHVKISIISLTSGLSLKLYLNSLLYHRNIFGSSSKVLGNLRKSSDIFGSFRKFSENVRERSSGVRDNLKNLRKSSEGGRKSSENHQKRRHQYVYIIISCSHSISHSFAALTRSISMWTLEDKFHISARPCTILYIHNFELYSLLLYYFNCNFQITLYIF